MNIKKKLKDIYFFKDCTEKEIDSVSSIITSIEVEKDRAVYYENSPAKYVYIIYEGYVEIVRYSPDDDRDYHVATLIKGDIFGIGEIFFDQYYVSAITLSKTLLFKIKKDDFFNIFLKIPSLNSYILKSLAYIIKQLHFMSDWTKSKDKFYHFLVYLAKEYGVLQNNEVVVSSGKILITHEHIANILNLSREQITRLFKLVKDEKILSVKKHSLYIDKLWYKKQLENLNEISFRRYFHFVKKGL